MIRLSSEAEAHLDTLREHFHRLERPEATRNLMAALGRAIDRIADQPDSGLLAPGPYPTLASLGLLWTKSGSYWFAYALTPGGAIIAGVFHDTADIPNRV